MSLPHAESTSFHDHLTFSSAGVEHAVVLYRREQVTAGRAAAMTGMSKPAFEAVLADRQIWLHYDEADLHADLAALDQLPHR